VPDITVTESGPTVSVSALGTPGPAGATGPTGATGAAGPTGPAGATGATGASGAAGTAGATWLQGSGVPSSGLGANGDYYLRSNGDVYTKTSGSWGSPVASILGPAGTTGASGAQGPTGPTGSTGANGAQGAAGATGAAGPAGSTGAAGADGKTVRNGSGTPSSGLGIDGDFYYDTTAHAIYGPKTSGAWGGGTSLIGPAGAAGATGPQGSTGATGAAGATGATGPAGTNGTNPAFRGTWSNSTSYAANDIVVLNERAFQAVQAGTGHDPLPATQIVTATPGTVDSGDGSPYEMGVKFTPTGDVRLTGVAFYKATANTGTHVGRIWQLAANGEYYKVNEATFTGETSSGWQTVPLAADLAAGTTYIVSCAFPAGHYSVDAHVYDSPVAAGSLTVPTGGGMYSTTVGHVPTNAFNNASYAVTPTWGEPNPTWWQEIGDWQILAGFPSQQESAAAYVLSQIGANGGLAGLDGSGHLASATSGAATVANGATTAVVAHGMSRTPTLRQVSAVATNSLGTAARFWVSAVDATNITITVDADPGATTATFAWQIHNL
jgi:hypothetical protein